MSRMRGALSGLKVVDLSRVLGGPFGTQMLADHGAEVIKVEPPQGDETREWGPPFQDEGISAYFSGVNRNKRSLGLDIATPKGQEVLLRLLEHADIMVENFKIGTMERWGIGFDEVLSKKFPRLIHARVTGFGAGGPYDGRPGYDAVIQAMTGLISINGSEEGGAVRLGIPLVDLGTGYNAVIGILMALYERERSGKGQSIEVALYDTGIQLLHPHGPNYHMSGKPPRLTGNAHPNISPYDLYPTRSGKIFLGVGNDRQFRIFTRYLGKPELADDPRFRTNALRVQNRPALTEEISSLLAGHDAATLADQLLAEGVPAGAALTLPEVMAHPQTAYREMVLARDNYKGPGIPIKLSRTPGGLDSLPPAYGADSVAVLEGAGFSADEIAALQQQGVVLDARRKD